MQGSLYGGSRRDIVLVTRKREKMVAEKKKEGLTLRELSVSPKRCKHRHGALDILRWTELFRTSSSGPRSPRSPVAVTPTCSIDMRVPMTTVTTTITELSIALFRDWLSPLALGSFSSQRAEMFRHGAYRRLSARLLSLADITELTLV